MHLTFLQPINQWTTHWHVHVYVYVQALQLTEIRWKLGSTIHDKWWIECFTGAVRQDITLEDQAYINYVSLGPVLAFLGATWENLGNNKWKVIFVDISLKVRGVQLLNKKFPENTTGIWRMSYLDDDFRVLYAAGGKVDTKTKNKDGKTENIYILQKKNWSGIQAALWIDRSLMH